MRGSKPPSHFVTTRGSSVLRASYGSDNVRRYQAIFNRCLIAVGGNIAGYTQMEAPPYMHPRVAWVPLRSHWGSQKPFF